MAYTDWLIRTRQIATYSCDYGCPCEFNAPPTRTPCEGLMGMEISEGYYGDARSDGLRIAGAYHWPVAVHEGNGTWWSVVDKRASEEQVNALFTILGGQDQEPTTGFAIYASTIVHEPDPVFADIEFEWNLEEATGRFKVDDVLEAMVEPIKNPVTGKPHRCSIKLVEGFEFREAEMASSSHWSRGEIDQRHDDCYATMFFGTYGPHGIIEQESTPHRNA
jgi:hypothetical protein